MLKEDKVIFDEMHKEGEISDEDYEKEVGKAPKESSNKEEKDKDKDKETEKPSEEDGGEKKEKLSKKPDEKKKDDEEEPKKEEKKTEKEEEPLSRTPMIPLSKHKKLKRKFKELKSQVSKGEKTKEKAGKEVEDELESYAKDNKLDGKQLNRLVGIIKKQVGVPEKKDDTVDNKELEKAKMDARLAKEETGFGDEFDKNVVPMLAKKYPKMTSVQEKKVKNILHDLAFSKELANTPLKYIYLGNIKKIRTILDIPKKKSAEGSRGTGAKGGKLKIGGLPLDREPTEEEFDNASDSEFDAWNEKMDKKSRSELRVLDTDGKEVK